jgi:uncharacterized protein DUF3768
VDLMSSKPRTEAGATMLAKAKAILMVKTFKNFTKASDPYGEHDFGYFQIAGETFYWKIDYYDLDCRYGSEDPSDPTKTIRVPTSCLPGSIDQCPRMASACIGARRSTLQIH